MYPELFDKDFPTMNVDQRLMLREISLDDASEYYFYMNHEGLKKYLAQEDIPTSVEHARHELNYWLGLFRNKYSIYWAIALKENNRIIGTCGFNNWNFKHDRAEISYDISYEFWNQGIATKVVKLLSDFAFDHMKILRIQATIEKSNFASMRVLAKNGYEREGILKKYAKLNFEQKDFVMYSKTKK